MRPVPVPGHSLRSLSQLRPLRTRSLLRSLSLEPEPGRDRGPSVRDERAVWAVWAVSTVARPNLVRHTALTALPADCLMTDAELLVQCLTLPAHRSALGETGGSGSLGAAPLPTQFATARFRTGRPFTLFTDFLFSHTFTRSPGRFISLLGRWIPAGTTCSLCICVPLLGLVGRRDVFVAAMAAHARELSVRSRQQGTVGCPLMPGCPAEDLVLLGDEQQGQSGP